MFTRLSPPTAPARHSCGQAQPRVGRRQARGHCRTRPTGSRAPPARPRFRRPPVRTPPAGPPARPRAQRERLHHVSPAPDPAVDQHLHPVTDRVHDLGQRIGAGQHGVELPAAVIGDDHPGRAVVDRQRASSAVSNPLTSTGCGLSETICSMSAQLRSVSIWAPNVAGVRRRSRRSLGRLPAAPRSTLLPARSSRSRIPGTGRSTVITSASYPHCAARWTSSRLSPRSLSTYS